mmetsp:Transcript_34981/g.84458  ORF Transcript_34981/g.84458 Transcript_34981/m.84458 type:complete len:84 (-) Transcript_34981:222-473(-)
MAYTVGGAILIVVAIVVVIAFEDTIVTTVAVLVVVTISVDIAAIVAVFKDNAAEESRQLESRGSVGGNTEDGEEVSDLHGFRG